jgi:hypothetical protein
VTQLTHPAELEFTNPRRIYHRIANVDEEISNNEPLCQKTELEMLRCNAPNRMKN